jgi:DNA-binding transcriptional ArsR family regulator
MQRVGKQLHWVLTGHHLVSYTECATKKCPITVGWLQYSTSVRRELVVVVSENNPAHDVFDAIADPTRRQLIRLLGEAGESPLHQLTEHFEMGRTAVSKHLAILKQAGLVVDRKVGRETRYRLNAAPLREVQDWLAFYRAFWSTNLLRLQDLLEEEEEK